MNPELEATYVSKIKKNLVFTIVKLPSGAFDIKSMGDGSSPLIADNYLPEVIEDVDFVIKSFQKVPPAGRICILNGEPGTGKTHLIRSILTQLDCVFLIIPSNMIESLDKPEFTPLLMKVKDEHEKSVIMIIEDGDVCLVPRENDNISTIASLLNLSDGIMGSIIDIKMIISTNANIEEMDRAILRPGRLCRNIHVGALPYEQANRVYRRLMKDDKVRLEDKRHYTLAEIYDRFNNIDTAPSQSASDKRVIGFTPSTKSNDNRTMNKGSKIGFGT
jgi:ATP-dependent 26S proteasome regulatory subunit